MGWPAIGRVIGRGTRISDWALRTWAPGYSRPSRSWAESGRSAGANRIMLPWATAVLEDIF